MNEFWVVILHTVTDAGWTPLHHKPRTVVVGEVTKFDKTFSK